MTIISIWLKTTDGEPEQIKLGQEVVRGDGGAKMFFWSAEIQIVECVTNNKFVYAWPLGEIHRIDAGPTVQEMEEQ